MLPYHFCILISYNWAPSKAAHHLWRVLKKDTNMRRFQCLHTFKTDLPKHQIQDQLSSIAKMTMLLYLDVKTEQEIRSKP